MDAKSLMIGDWVIRHIGDYANPYGKIVLKIKDCFDLADYVKYDPIPLTAEILEKNGFVQVEDGIQEYDFPEGIWQNDNLLCGLDYNHRGMFYTFSNNPEEDKLINQIYGIFYVHDLQRALRLCGLNELADNFMV